ncbi:hypothetical protein [Demequina sp. NBRC 110057]|uniref:hypothetical protein n=1 Tax=Demequina sp. NBRC 110057 TaxID=1570346 RepID=UPI001177D504|nr:hypothetical protein [Demequina sp. NBRC 110057]
MPDDRNENDQPTGATPPEPPGGIPSSPPPQSTPPPQPGQYGATPPPPPGYGTQGVPGGDGAPTVGDAFNWGWTKFTQNVGPILLGVLAYFVAFAVLTGIAFALLGGASGVADDDANVLTAMFSFGFIVIWVLFLVLSLLMQAGIIRASLEISHGRTVELRTFFAFDDFGKLLVAVLLVGLGTAIGSVLCYLPGLIFAFFAQFTLLYVIDKSQGPVDAIKSSFALVNRNLASVVLLYLGVVLAMFIGYLLCGIGIIVAMPVAMLATTYMYRRLNGEQVAA